MLHSALGGVKYMGGKRGLFSLHIVVCDLWIILCWMMSRWTENGPTVSGPCQLLVRIDEEMAMLWIFY